MERGLVEEVLMTPGDCRLDLGSGVEAEAVGLGDGVNGSLWSEREVGKFIWFGGKWCTHMETCCLGGNDMPTVLCAFSSPGSEERTPVGLDSDSQRDMRMRVSTQASAHLHVLGGG